MNRDREQIETELIVAVQQMIREGRFTGLGYNKDFEVEASYAETVQELLEELE